MYYKEIQTIVGIDPSINEAGVAAVDINGKPTMCAQVTGVGGNAQEWQQKALVMANNIAMLVQTVAMPAIVICETPGNWFTAKGMDSKASGSIQKLYCMVGMIVTAIQRVEGVTTILTCEPAAWKGNLPKEVLLRRGHTYLAEHGMDDTFPDDDAAEALMIAYTSWKRLLDDAVGKYDVVWHRNAQTANAIIKSMF